MTYAEFNYQFLAVLNFLHLFTTLHQSASWFSMRFAALFLEISCTKKPKVYVEGSVTLSLNTACDWSGIFTLH